MSVSFTIDGLPGPIQVSGDDLRLLKDACPRFRSSIDDPHRQGPIRLAPNEDKDINIDSIRYILQNIGLEKQLERLSMTPEERLMHRNVEIEDLSQQCNALYHYRFNPRPFKGLWDRLRQPCEPTPRPSGTWAWRKPRGNIPKESWPYYANAAYVLEKDKEFSDALCSIVWDSGLDTFKTPVIGLQNMQQHRLRFMESLFRVMTSFIGALNDVDHKISREIQERIAADRNLDLHLSGSIEETRIADPFERSRSHLENRTIYGFALQVDMALLKDTDLRELKQLFFPKNQYIETVVRMLNFMDAQITQDQRQLTEELLTARTEAYSEAAPASSAATHHLGGINGPVATPGGGPVREARDIPDTWNGNHAPGSSIHRAQYGDQAGEKRTNTAASGS